MKRPSIWLIDYVWNGTAPMRLALIEFKETSKGLIKPVYCVNEDEAERQELKWNLKSFEQAINIQVTSQKNSTFDLTNVELSQIKTCIEQQQKALGIMLGDIYIQRQKCKNYASFTFEELKTNFLKLQ